MIGRNKSRTSWRVLKIDRLEPLELNISEDSTTYSETECSELLKRIHEGNRSTGGLKFVIICYGIVGMYIKSEALCCITLNNTVVLPTICLTDIRCFSFAGFIKFLGPYYMLLITKRRKIGVICGHEVYAVTKSEMIPLPNASVQSNIANTKNENRSYVHSTCKCEMLGVLLKRFVSKGVLLKRFVFKLYAYPVYLDIKLFKCEILSCYFFFQLSEMNHLESKANRHFLCALWHCPLTVHYQLMLLFVFIWALPF